MGTEITASAGRAALLIGALAVAAGAARPAVAATQTGTIAAVTVKPLSIVKVKDLDFGLIASGSGAGTIIIDPTNDAQSATGGANGPVAMGNGVAAQFYTYGGPLQFVSVTRGPLPTLSNGSGGTMTVSQLTLNGPTTRYLSSAGVLDLRVGGTLNIGANQAPGTYTGTFQITVTYF